MWKYYFCFSFFSALFSRVSSHTKWHWTHRSRIRYTTTIKQKIKFRTLCCSRGKHTSNSVHVYSVQRLHGSSSKTCFFGLLFSFFLFLSRNSRKWSVRRKTLVRRFSYNWLLIPLVFFFTAIAQVTLIIIYLKYHHILCHYAWYQLIRI